MKNLSETTNRSSQVKIVDLVGPNCGSRNEGGEVYKYLNDIWDKEDKIIVDFNGIKIATSSFFNAAFTPFVFDFPIETVLSKLEFVGLSDKDKYLINRAFSLAKKQAANSH